MSEIDYTAVLDDLRGRRQQLDQAIAGIEAVIAGIGPAGLGAQNNGNDTELRSDSFFNLSVREGTVKLLKIRKRAMSAKEISEALETGGMISTAKDFYQTVYTGLARAESDGILMKHPGTKKYGLPEWYGGRQKAKVQKEAAEDAAEPAKTAE